jgi:hypothetical protein
LDREYTLAATAGAVDVFFRRSESVKRPGT